MDVEERCLYQLTRDSAPSNGIYQNGCYGCSRDPVNNPRCPGYSKVKVIPLQVRKKQRTKLEKIARSVLVTFKKRFSF